MTAWKTASNRAVKTTARESSPTTTNKRPKLPKVTVGELSINLGAFVAYALLGGAAIYNAHLYFRIISELLPLPWLWLQVLVGVSIWGLIQIGELLPFLIRSEVGFMALIALATERFKGVDPAIARNPTSARLAKRINNFPARWLWGMGAIGGATFLVDFIMVWYYFEPIQLTGFLPSISITALFQIALTVVLFQSAFCFALYMNNGKWFLKTGK